MTPTRARSNRYLAGLVILVLLVVLVVATGLYSTHLGVSQMWDVRNYHIYNPFAAAGGRYLEDIAPAQLQTFFNPALDFPFSLMIRRINDHPRLIAFLLGATHGLNLLCIALLAWHLLGRAGAMSTPLRAVLAALALLIGATGAGSTPLIGAATGDLEVAVPVLAALLTAVYAVDRARADPTQAMRLLAFSGLLGGLAVGLKLTMAIYGVALVASLLVLPRALRAGGASRFAGGGLVGLLIGGGPHFLAMWRLFGNPFFPMLNTVFHSPYWEAAALRDERFLPKNWIDWLLYPFEWAEHARPLLVSEFAFRDIRIALAIALGLLVVLTWLASRLMRRPRSAPISPGFRVLIIFMLVAYLCWLALFSIYRYLIPLELLSGVVIVLAIGRLVTHEAWPVLAAATAGLCIVTTIPLEWGHAPFRDRYVEVTAPALQPDTLVVIVGADPVAYLAPFFDPHIRWVSVMNNFLRPEQDNLLVRHARDLVREHRGPLMVLEAGATDADITKALSSLSLMRGSGDCAQVWSNLGAERYQLCPAELRLPQAGQ